MNDVRDMAAAWERLHRQPRFRPQCPSESVVRFVARRFGGIAEPAAEPRELLDIGCGAGRHTGFVAEAGHRVTAVDISDEGLEHARAALTERGLDARFERASMTELPFDDGSFDGAISFGVFCYGDEDDMRSAVSEAFRVLRPDGRLLVVTRSTEDDRFELGERVAPRTVRLEDDRTNEVGMTMHFLDREGIEDVFSPFREVLVDRVDHTDGGGALRNVDWVIEALR